MALTEIIGSRRQYTSGTRLTFVRHYEALKSEVIMGAGGWVGSGITLPAKGDALDIGTFVNAVTPRVYNIQLVPHKTRGKTGIVVSYGAPLCQGTATGTRIELADSQDHEVDDEGKWAGYRRFSTPDADITTNRVAVAALSWTVGSLAMTPKRTHVAVDPNCPGTSIITGEYRAPEDPNHFVVGRGYLSVVVDTMAARAVLDAAGTGYIEGASATDLDKGLHWKTVKGSNITRVRRVIVRVTTAFDRSGFDWDTHVSDYFDANGRPKANSDACANILGAAAGELLMLGAEIPQAFVLDANNTKIPVVYTMLYQPGGVEKDPTGVTLTVAKFHRTLAMKYVLHPTDTAAARKWMANDGTALAGDDSGPTVTTNAKYRIATVDKKLDGTDATRTLYGTTAYSAINSLIWWGSS